MKDFIKKIYGSIAKGKNKGCCTPDVYCCSTTSKVSQKIGYTKEELESIPQEVNMGLGCGNPVALASLKEGETVVDFGSGGGIDVFLAARKVGEKGKVIGIDMTGAMIQKARKNAKKAGFKNVEFKMGDIEEIPLENNIADCVISNCVINLAEDKQKVFNESFRILKIGGRLMISDMVLTADLPEKVLKSAEMYAGCISGALKKEDYLGKIRNAGFKDVTVVKEDAVRLLEYIGSDETIKNVVQCMSEEEISTVSNALLSIKISATK
ncbi:MAG: arsenite methyltransferase [Candidatus Omnitrophica bacterium]|nr:arsenite methyltransferase [Candidatus Omnitrophota bacterium]